MVLFHTLKSILGIELKQKSPEIFSHPNANGLTKKKKHIVEDLRTLPNA